MGIHLLRVQFSTTLSQFSQFSQSPFLNFASYTPFLDQPIEEKSELENSIEALLESQQNKFDSQFFQNQNSYSVTPVQNRKPSILEMSMRESKQQSQNLTDSRFTTYFKTKLHLFKSNRNNTMNQSIMKSCLKP